ncbi:ABC transporter permease [Myxococcota bacterium]|nr:ABC transporter permease [Myxococcota bacterium]MBU1498437.1 ABC transporter permease [Myxococcota bacterium]
MMRILAIAIKDLKQIARDRGTFFFTFIFPVIYAIAFGFFFSGQFKSAGNQQLHVVDLDNSEISAKFIDELRKSGGFIINKLTTEVALKKTSEGAVPVFLKIDKGFAQNFATALITGNKKISFHYDPSKPYMAASLEGIAIKSWLKLWFSSADINIPIVRKDMLALIPEKSPMKSVIASFFDGLGAFSHYVVSYSKDAKFAAIPKTPVTMGAKPPGPFDVSFPQGIIWGIIGCIAAFVLGFVIERTSGTLSRIRSAPITLWEFIAGKALASIFTIFLISVMMALFAKILFGLRISSIPLFLLSSLFVAISFSGVMMLMASVAKTEQSAGAITWPAFMILAMFGGGMIPLHFMPSWMVTASQFSPVGWAIHVLEATTWRGTPFSAVWHYFVFLGGLGLLSFIAGTILLKRSLCD